MLILNSHSSYLSAGFNAFCKDNAIICLCIPLYISYLLQLLDVSVFGPLKRAYGKLVKGIIEAGNNHIDKEDFLHLYLPTRKEVFNRRNIHSGFAGAGLNPLDKDRVLKKITF